MTFEEYKEQREKEGTYPPKKTEPQIVQYHGKVYEMFITPNGPKVMPLRGRHDSVRISKQTQFLIINEFLGKF